MPGVPTKNGEPFGSPFESGRRDLNPRPPEPHSGALPGCATSRLTKPQEQVAQTPSGSQSHVSSHQNQPRTTCSLTGLRGACPERSEGSFKSPAARNLPKPAHQG